MLPNGPNILPQRALELATSYIDAIITHALLTLSPLTLLRSTLSIYTAPLSLAIILISISLFRFLYLVRPSTASKFSTPISSSSTSSTPNPTLTPSNKPPRTPGTWHPQPFHRPAASPYPNWDIHATKPLPYRPFKFGPHHITMGIRAMKWDEWIELDNRYLEWHAIKAKRIEERREKCCRTAPEAFDGAMELLEELFSYLPQRYPTLFSAPTPTTLTNLVTHETFSIEIPLRDDPMTIAGRLIQDDLALMIERSDGQYYLLAGSILLAGFWRLSDKFGMPLSEIHTSGSVPAFKPKLERGMMNFFRRLQPPNPVVRNNFFIQVDSELGWSKTLGPEDGDIGWTSVDPVTDAMRLYFRSERQSLRRLPRSGAIVFTIRVYLDPIDKIATETGVPGRLASAIRAWGEETIRYKGRERYGDSLLAYLDQRHEEQVERGEVVEGDIADEQDEKYGRRYPF